MCCNIQSSEILRVYIFFPLKHVQNIQDLHFMAYVDILQSSIVIFPCSRYISESFLRTAYIISSKQFKAGVHTTQAPYSVLHQPQKLTNNYKLFITRSRQLQNKILNTCPQGQSKQTQKGLKNPVWKDKNKTIAVHSASSANTGMLGSRTYIKMAMLCAHPKQNLMAAQGLSSIGKWRLWIHLKSGVVLTCTWIL